MGSENGYGMQQPPMQPLPPKSQLDAQTERLAEQAEDIGWLKGQNDMLNEDNRRLEQENGNLRGVNERLQRQLNEAQNESISEARTLISTSINSIKEALPSGKVKK